MLSGPQKVRVTCPSGQIPLGVNSSRSQTTPSTSKAASRDVNFCRLFSEGTYSVSSLFLPNLLKSLLHQCPCRIFQGKCLVENGSRNIAEGPSKQEVVWCKWVVVFVVASHVSEWTRVDKTLGFTDDRVCYPLCYQCQFSSFHMFSFCI